MSIPITSLIAKQTTISEHQINAVLKLFAEGATIPFIARYRKEVTGELDEVQIAEIQQAQKQFEELERRRESILKSIEEQGKLTPELAKRIKATYNPTELEDLYLPYKRKRKTRAGMARDRGLAPLAKIIFEQRNNNIETLAADYLSDDIATIEDALQGARDIIAEEITENEKADEGSEHIFEEMLLSQVK